MPVDEAKQAIIEDFDLTDEQAEELHKDPQTWIRENILEQPGLVEVKPRSKRRPRKSADDG